MVDESGEWEGIRGWRVVMRMRKRTRREATMRDEMYRELALRVSLGWVRGEQSGTYSVKYFVPR